MRKRVPYTLILILLTGIPLYAQSPPTGTLEIEFTGIRTLEGQIAAGLNSSPEGWPNDPEVEYVWTKEEMASGKLVVRIEGLEYGTYAISVLDDVDLDLEMKMFMGIPREGFGLSMNPHHQLSMPDFGECAFEIDQPLTRITIEINYIAKRNKAKD